MADEQAQEEVETSESEQPSEEVESVSEDVTTPTEPDQEDRGDLRIALKQEREKRQELERQQSDPYYVYQQAEKLGLTAQEQAQQEIDAPPTPAQPNLYPLMDDFYKYKEAVKEFPQAESDVEIADMINGMVQAGKKPADAVKLVQKRLVKQAEKIASEETQKAQAEEVIQNKAQTAGVEHDVSSDAEEMTDLIKRSKSLDPVVQREAHVELLKIRNKKAGIT